MDKAEWESKAVTDKVGYCQSAGLSGRVASKAWDELLDYEVLAIRDGIKPDYTLYRVGRSDTDAIYDRANYERMVTEKSKVAGDIVARILASKRMETK